MRADRHAEQDVVDEDGLAGDDGGRVVGGRGLECEGRVELAVLRQDVDLNAEMRPSTAAGQGGRAEEGSVRGMGRASRVLGWRRGGEGEIGTSP